MDNPLPLISSQEEDKLQYWQEKLKNVSFLETHKDNVSLHAQKAHGAAINFTIEKSLMKGLQQLSDQQGATLFIWTDWK